MHSQCPTFINSEPSFHVHITINDTVVELQLYLDYQTEVLVIVDITLGSISFVAVTCPGCYA
jgi:hypothetical protein